MIDRNDADILAMGAESRRKYDELASMDAESAEFPNVEHVVDYGSDAVIVPGLISADSFYGSGSASQRTADPGVRAVDHLDSYSDSTRALVAGVTSFYVAPARGRLIADCRS